MSDATNPDCLVVVPSGLGWLALIGAGRVVRQLTFAHDSPQSAIAALDPQLALEPQLVEHTTRDAWNQPLLRRLQAYAEGEAADFRDVPIDPGPLTVFQRRVVRRCRQIPYGQTLTYGQLAAAVGSPSAARAVGNCMAANRIPLIVPCHRVVAANGQIGSFSAPGGTQTKRHLLTLEGVLERI